MEKFLQLTLTGLTNGAILSLVALGFVLIYKASDVINFAQGDFMVVGAFITYGLIVQVGLPWSIGVLVAVLLAALLGVLIERFILRPMIGEPIISVIMVTIGLSSLLRAVVSAIWGTTGRPFPPFLPSQPVQILGATVPADRLIAIGLVIILFVIFTLFFRFTREGIAMRATADGQQAQVRQLQAGGNPEAARHGCRRPHGFDGQAGHGRRPTGSLEHGHQRQKSLRPGLVNCRRDGRIGRGHCG